MFKKLKQRLAVLLALILTALSPLSGVSGLLTGNLVFAREESVLKSYLVPVKELTGSWDNYNEKNGKTVNTDNGERPQIKDYALVNENADGSYTVRLEYASYHLYDMVQVLNTERISNLKETYISFISVPFGNFNAPVSAQDYKKPDVAQFDIDRNFITQTVNDNYEKEVKVGLADPTMDVGYIEIKVRSLNNDIPIKWYASAIRQKNDAYWSFTEGMFIRLEEGKKILLSKDKSLEDGVQAAGYQWTDYSEKNSDEVYNGERNVSAAALNTLNNLFKNEVKIEKKGDGSLKAVFSLRDLDSQDPVTSIKIAKEKKLNSNIYKKRKSSNWAMSEYQYVEWEELFAANTQTIELDFKNLTDAKLFQVSTRSKDEKNSTVADDKKTFFYGTLWLTRDIASEVKEVVLQNTSEMDARLVSTSDVIPEDATFTLKRSIDDQVTKSKSPSTAQTVTSYAKDKNSWAIYDFSVKDKNGGEITPTGQISVEIALPEFYKGAASPMLYYADGSYDGWNLPEHNGASIGQVITRDGREYLKITPVDLNHQVFSLAFIDAGTPMSEADIAALEPGYYRVNTNFTITLLSGPSMANPVIDNSMGAILHVKEKGGAYEIFMRFKSMKITRHAYVTGFKMYNGSLDGGSEPATVYKYTSLADTNPESWEDYGYSAGLPEGAEDQLIFEELSKKYHIHYQNIVSMPLENRYNARMKGWYVGVLSPLMNEAVGSPMDEEKQTILRLAKETLEPVEGNYLGTYHPSILKAQIDQARWYLDTIEGKAREQLSADIDAAQVEYISQKQHLDEGKLLAAVEALKQAMVKAGSKEPGGKALADGSYEIGYALYRGELTEDVPSDYARMFDKAYLTVAGEEMTLELLVHPDFLSSIDSMFYENGSSAARADRVEKEGKTFYVIRKKYTEKPFELGIKAAGEDFPDVVRIALDFASAKPRQQDTPDTPKPDEPKPDEPKPNDGYTGAFLELDNLLKTQEGKLAGNYEESSYQAYQSSVAAARDLLQNHTSYRAGEEAAKRASLALEKEFASLIREDQLKGSTVMAMAFNTDLGYSAWEEYEKATASNADWEEDLPLHLNAVFASQPVTEVNLGGTALSDGEYTVDYALWQFGENKPSMGNPATGDALENKAGKQAKLVISNGTAYLQLGFHQMSFNLAGVLKTGHLLDMVIMDNLVSADGVVESYDPLPPVNIQYSEEKDDYGPPAGRKYPSSLTFDITKWVAEKQEYIPVQVNVPVMEASAIQPARIRLYWGTLSDGNGNSIKNPGKKPEQKPEQKPETGIAASQEYKDLQSLLSEMSLDLSDRGYTEISQKAFADSYKAGEKLLEYGKDASLRVTAEMLSQRKEALTAAKAARVSLGQNPDQKDTPRGDFAPLKAAMKNVLSILQGSVRYTQDSLNLLSFEYDQASAMLQEGTATKEQIMAQVNALKEAIKGLKVAEPGQNPTPNNNGGNQNPQNNPDQKGGNQKEKEDKDTESKVKGKEGYYTVPVALWHSSMNKASMGNPALNKTAYVHISGDTATMRLITKQMTTSGITTHLYDFFVYDGSDYGNAKLVSTEKDQWIYEFDLPNTKSSYYKVMVDPKVDVMGTDPVKARLKVTWGSLKKTTEEKWDKLTGEVDESKTEDKTAKTTAAAKTGELVDAATGIRVSGALGGPDVRLSAVKTESELANKALEGKVTKFLLYDIKLKSGETAVQPNGTVQLRFPLPQGYDPAKLVLYYIPEQGEAVLIRGSVKDGFFEANVDHFSLYALAESTQVQNQTQPETKALEASFGGSSSGGNVKFVSAAPKAPAASGTKESVLAEKTGSSNLAADGRKIPYTGDKTPVSALLILLFMSLLGAGSTWMKKRRKY